MTLEPVPLSRQTLEILTRLRLGPATSDELATIALKYTGRISDARAAGYVITGIRLPSGLMRYTLQDAPEAPPDLQVGLFDRLTPLAMNAVVNPSAYPSGPTAEKIAHAAITHAADYRCERCGRATVLRIVPTVIPPIPGQYRAECRDGCARPA